MKNTVSIPTRFSSRARVLTGCVVLALSGAALGQADRQSTDRPATANLHDTDDHQTFEGKLVSLFHALNGHENGSADPMKLNRESGSSTRPGSATQPGQPGASTRPGSATQPGSTTQPGSSTQPGSLTQPGQPGSATQPGSADRSQGQVILPGQSNTTSAQAGLDSSPSSMGAMPIGQPLALITDSGMSPGSAERSRSTGEGRPSTPPVGSTSASTSQRSTAATGNSGASATTQGGGMYVLVFDPSDPASRSAYQMAQAIVRSEASGSTGAIGTQGTRDSLGTPGTTGATGARDSAASRSDSRVSPGTAGATSDRTSGTTGGITAGTDRQQDSQANATTRSPSGMASSMGDKVKITGRVIERDGVQAIAVQKVERQYGDSTASVSPAPSNQ